MGAHLHGQSGLLDAPKRGLIEITERGRQVLREGHIDNGTLARFPEFKEWVRRSGKLKLPVDAPLKSDARIATRPNFLDDASTPQERIGRAVRELEEALKSELLARVRDMRPDEFERLIVQLLLAMGYGQGSEELAQAIGGTGDGGLDGVVHQDPLGLDRVYIQAKRYKEGSGIGSRDIRDFVGALNIKRASKGVFVTASHFTGEAKFAAQGSTVHVVLVDGDRLAELMVRNKVGVLVRSTIEIGDLDEGFFET